MTSKFTREELLNIIETDHVQCGEASALARMALAAMDSEPVAEILSSRPGNDTSTIDRALPVGTQLYRHAQQPVVLDDGKLRELFDAWFASDCSFDLSPEASEADNIAWRESYWYVWKRCRAAMLQAGTLNNEGTIQAGNSPAIPDGSAVAALTGIPMIPDGYVMVPKEPTAEMILSAMRDNETGEVAEIYELMLAAAPQSPGSEPATVPGKWIPVSEQMPDDDDFVYIWPRPDFGVELHVGQYCERSHKGGGWYAQVYEQNHGIEWHPITVTHWMQLPAAPQEVK
ncbi:DUF551 domain-containing protein [Klebsiella pneumoniae]|uniref:DUF551 domain-containing protein n=1 Tax=Klebsiella pneumoniae TaxID=573 RepID=UPI001CD14AB2|nr:DUF551 domain-containing protein [Klebsiella pneumoniae]